MSSRPERTAPSAALAEVRHDYSQEEPEHQTMTEADRPRRRNRRFLAALPVCLLASGCGWDLFGLGGDEEAARLSLPLVSIAAAGGHSCAVASNGRAYCWGDNTEGQLGNGTKTSSPVPVRVGGGVHFIRLSASGFTRWPEYGVGPYPLSSNTCGLDGQGSAYCWGDAGSGQLGNGIWPCVECGWPDATTPSRVLGGAYREISTGARHACAISAGGTTYCWGDGVAGSGGFNGPDTLPGRPYDFLALSAGGRHTCALNRAGQPWCWGVNRWGELGIASSGLNDARDLPTRITGEWTFDRIDSGDSHTCALTPAGAAYCWGRNDHGQLGTGELNPVCTDDLRNTYACPDDPAGPRPVTGGVVFQSLAVGQLHTCGLDPGGRAFCWGRRIEGQLGFVATASAEPRPVETALRFTAIAAGSRHTCAIATDGKAYCWGWARYGQLGNGGKEDVAKPTLVSGQEP